MQYKGNPSGDQSLTKMSATASSAFVQGTICTRQSFWNIIAKLPGNSPLENCSYWGSLFFKLVTTSRHL